jgi:hypothetical protein
MIPAAAPDEALGLEGVDDGLRHAVAPGDGGAVAPAPVVAEVGREVDGDAPAVGAGPVGAGDVAGVDRAAQLGQPGAHARIGGAGGGNSNGGGGGGALMFAVDGELRLDDGVITVGGCGGAAGGKGKGGSGGGAGGAIVIEARTITFTPKSVLAANGGGGGGGGGGTGGLPGQGSVTPATGGLAGDEGSGGGAGGARGMQAGSHLTQGGDGLALPIDRTAGGGGGVKVMRRPSSALRARCSR